MKRNWDDIKKRAENISGSTTIIANKSQFKGNTVNIWACTSNKHKEIVVSNTYYTGHVRQVYDINTDTTSINYNTSTHSPKWLNKLFGPNGDKGIRVEMTNMSCSFEPWMYYLDCETKDKGLMFKGNIDNINTLKELKHELSKVRSMIKKYTLEELTELSTEQDNDTHNFHRNIMVIKYNDLVKFDRRMSDHSE